MLGGPGGAEIVKYLKTGSAYYIKLQSDEQAALHKSAAAVQELMDLIKTKM